MTVVWSVCLYARLSKSLHEVDNFRQLLIAKFHYTDPTLTRHGQSPRTLLSTS